MRAWRQRDRLIRHLQTLAVRFETDVPLARFTSLRIGGVVPLIVWPEDARSALAIFHLFTAEHIPWKIMGAGSNLLIPDGPHLPWVIVKLDRMQRVRDLGNARVEVEAGMMAPKLTSWCAARGIGGLEFLAGIPGQVGGVIRMNAGAFGDTVGRHLVRVWFWQPGARDRCERRVEPAQFGYRSSPFQGPHVVLGAELQGHPEDPQQIQQRLHTLKQRRLATQPLQEPSAGCAFKNPNHGQTPAGRLLEHCGLKGYRHGDARFSELHANFIVNTGQATYRDVRTLLAIAQRRVQETFGLWLEPELVIWHDDLGPGDEPWTAVQ